MYENSYNSNDEAIAKRKEIEAKKAEADRVRKEKHHIRKERNAHVDNIVYTIHLNREVGRSADVIKKYDITYYELVAGLKRVYKVDSWAEYIKVIKKTFETEKLFDFRANIVPNGKIVARSDKFDYKYATLTKDGQLYLVNEKQLTVKKYTYYPEKLGTMVVRIFSGNKIIVANLMWATFKNKNTPKHTIIGYRDNNKTNLDITNLYIKRQGLKGDK